MSYFRITVSKILEGGTCPAGLKVGDEFILEDSRPPMTIPNFCAWAFHEMFPILLTLKYGGRFPWEEKGNANYSCSDSKNPVVFHMEFVEEETAGAKRA